MKRQYGFTIVEIAVVIFIIGILIGMTVVVFGKVQASTRDNDRKSDVLTLKAAIQRYINDNGEAPWPGGIYAKDTGYDVSIISSFLVPRYLQAMPTPPTSAAYQYTVSGTTSSAWAILVPNEASSQCTVGSIISPGWWSGPPKCAYN